MKSWVRTSLGLASIVLGTTSVWGQPQFFANTGHWYEAVRVADGILWDPAKAEAEGRGGYLACITSAAENGFAGGLAQDVSYYSDFSVNGDRLGPWLGGFHTSSSPWSWLSAEAFSYSNWHPSQPDGYAGSDQRIGYYNGASVGLTWADHPGVDIAGYHRPRGFIVEYDHAPIRGTLTMEDYNPSPAGLQVVFSIYQGGSVVDSPTAILGPNGEFSITTPITGLATLVAKGSHWLGRTVNTLFLGSTPYSGLHASLYNGDCNDDDEIGIGDYALISAAYNSFVGDPNWIPGADLNGDEAIDIGDYGIMSANYGFFGD